jgi:ribosomal protein L4
MENWTRQLNRKMKAQALRVALSMQADKIVVTDNLNGLKGKTKEAAKVLSKMLGEMGRTVIVLGENTTLMRQGLRNIDRVLPISVTELTALQVAAADTIVFTKDSLEALETRLATKKALKAKPEVKKVTAVPAVAKKASKKSASTKKTKRASKTRGIKNGKNK